MNFRVEFIINEKKTNIVEEIQYFIFVKLLIIC